MKLKLLLAILVSGLIGYAGFWFFLYLNTGAFLENSKEDLEAHGIVMAYSDVSIGGFPYRLEVTLKEFSLSFKNGPLSAAMESPRMEVITHPWNLGHFILFPDEAKISFSMGKVKSVFLSPGVTSISFVDERDKGYRLSLVMDRSPVRSTFPIPLPENLEKFSFHIRKDLRVSNEAEGLFEPKQLEIAFDGLLPDSQTFNFLTYFRGQDVPALNPAGLGNWRDNGGTFEIESFQIHQNNKTILGSGSFSVDEMFRPLGAVGLEGASNDELIAFFYQAGLLKNEQLVFLKDFLDTLPQDATQNNEFNLSISAQNGFLNLGPAQLMTLDPLIRE